GQPHSAPVRSWQEHPVRCSDEPAPDRAHSGRTLAVPPARTDCGDLMSGERGPWRPLPTIAAVIGFSLLYLPLFAVLIYSFNATPMGLTWTGFSVRWYSVLMTDTESNRRAWEVREAA